MMDAGKGLAAERLIASGYAARRAGQLDVALEHYQGAVELLRTAGDALRLAHTVRHVGDILGELGRVGEAVPCFEEALQIYAAQREAPPLDVANAIAGYARMLNARARELWLQALPIYRDLGIQAGVAEAEARIGLHERD